MSADNNKQKDKELERFLKGQINIINASLIFII